ncbi:hypothetical protein Tco_0631098 [Tanacetum coccineum]
MFNFVPLSYENGYVFHWRLRKEKKVDYASMCSYLKETTCQPFYALFFCLPECTLEVGLEIIKGDCDVASMHQFADAYGTINKRVVDKCKSHVKKKVDNGKSLLKKTVDKGKSKMLVDDILVKKHVHKNNEIVIKENVNPSTMVTHSYSESEVGHEFNYTLYTDSESDYSDKPVDYLSEGENEMIELRKKKTKAKKAPKTSNH